MKTGAPLEAPTAAQPAGRRALLVGYFSTMGDLECLEVVKKELASHAIAFDVAPFAPDVAAAMGTPTAKQVGGAPYSMLLVICGPCSSELFAEFDFDIGEFWHCRRIGINLSMVLPSERWNPFTRLIERDSERSSRPDLSFLGDTPLVPVVALCVIETQPEYGDRQDHQTAIRALEQLVTDRGLAAIRIDTRWPPSRNKTGITGSAELASVMARVDCILTNRLHGMVLALRQGTPALVIDGITGGAKVSEQAKVIGWPICRSIDEVDAAWLDASLDRCLSEQARDEAAEVSRNAKAVLEGALLEMEAAFDAPVANNGPRPPRPVQRRQSRRSASWTRKKVRMLRRLLKQIMRSPEVDKR